MNKKVIITGASGLIGRQLFKELLNRGDEITIFARDPASAKQQLPGAKDYVKWDYLELDPWQKMVDGKNAIIHLAGANISGKRWTEKYKKEILESRIISTQNLIKAIGNSNNKPECFIISSAVGYYGDAGNETLTEASPSGNDFLSKVCTKWELESHKVDELGIRRVNVRTGVVISADGGALKKMLLPFKFFVGGPLGNGKQWFPWLHIDDIIRIYLFALDNPNIQGPLNAVSPGLITMKNFAENIGEVLHRPSIFSVPKIILKIIIGETAEPILASQRVIPEKLLQSGFKFKFENIENALTDLL
jgi:hypothetical protein